ncbi:MAG: hypothetical protein LC792_16645 [Actinobacteria bacterium]|nr:hypothetical protein [Actinomycetota bacterium]
MRRTASSVLVMLGLFAASLAWWSFAARFTVLDSGRSAKIADTLVEQPVIRDAVAEGLGSALERALPPGTPISTEELDAVTHRALDDPRAIEAVRDTVLKAHQRLIGTYDGPVTIDVSPIAVAGRDALLAARPDLAESIPEAPPLSIDLPTQHLPKLGWLPERARELVGLAGLLAATFLGLGMLAASDRPKVLQRAGRWALRAGIGWAFFGWALPYAMTNIAEPRLAALGAIGVAAVGPMIAPALTLVCAGIGGLLGARAWRLALAALPPAPPSGGPLPGPRPAPLEPAARPGEPYGRPREPVGSTRTWRF